MAKQVAVHLKLLSAMAKGDYEKAGSFVRGSGFDSKNFADFIIRNNLAGYLYSILNQAHLIEDFPDALVRRCKLSYLEQWRNNEKFLREILELAESLKESGSEVVFLKGLFLAQRFYGDIDRRSIADIDIMVKSLAEIRAVDSVLLRRGFVRKSEAFLNGKLTYHFSHHYEYEKQGLGLELHWALQSHFSFRIDYEKIWNTRRDFIFKDRVCYALSDEYMLVAIILSIFTDIQLGEATLKSFVDVYRILKGVYGDVNWESFFEERRSEGLSLISLNVLDLVLSVLDCGEDFHDISAYIERERKLVRLKDLNDKMNLLEYSPFAIRGKRWAFHLYETPLFLNVCWWALSMPVKFAVYRGSNPRLIKWLRAIARGDKPV